MTLLGAGFYGEQFAAEHHAHPASAPFYAAAAGLFLSIITDAEIHPELGPLAMTVLTGSAPPAYTTVTPWPVDGQAVVLVPKPVYLYAAPFAASVGTWAEILARTMTEILADVVVDAAGLTAPAPPGGGPLLGEVMPRTTRPEDFYSERLIVASKCPRGSTQERTYRDFVGLMFRMMDHAVVPGAGFIAPVPPPPIVPPAVPPPSVPLPIGGIARFT